MTFAIVTLYIIGFITFVSLAIYDNNLYKTEMSFVSVLTLLILLSPLMIPLMLALFVFTVVIGLFAKTARIVSPMWGHVEKLLAWLFTI